MKSLLTCALSNEVDNDCKVNVSFYYIGFMDRVNIYS